MKKILASLLIMSIWSSTVFGCDWKAIKQQGSEFVYTADCHKEVGKLVKQVGELQAANEERQKESEKLNKAITLKDLALDKSDQRMMNWRAEAYNQNERLLRQEKLSKVNDWLYFGGGIGLTILSVWAAGQIKSK